MRTSLLLLTFALAAACSAPTGGDAVDDDVASLDSGAASEAPDEDSSAAPTDPQEAMLAFAECMRDHGIDMPDPQVAGEGEGGFAIVGESPGPGEGPADREDFEAAEEACRPIMENVIEALPEPDPEQMAAMREYELAVTECVREHGLDIPDPEFQGGGVTMEIPEGIDMEELQAAQEECREGLGDPQGFGPGGGSFESSAVGVVQ